VPAFAGTSGVWTGRLSWRVPFSFPGVSRIPANGFDIRGRHGIVFALLTAAPDAGRLTPSGG